jgi:hypothetical protein
MISPLIIRNDPEIRRQTLLSEENDSAVRIGLPCIYARRALVHEYNDDCIVFWYRTFPEDSIVKINAGRKGYFERD